MNKQLAMLDEAEVHFNNHRFTEGADLVWNAAFQSIAQAARALGIPCENRDQAWPAAKKLDQIRPNPELRYITTILHASVYPEYAATQHEPDENQWEPHEYIDKLDGHRQMVAALQRITEEKATLIA